MIRPYCKYCLKFLSQNLWDKVACLQVLDGGRIHEYDEPHVLLQNKDGIFYKMVQQTGKAEAASLIQLAKEVQKAVTKHAYLYL